jgi:hypothetical protein
MTHPTLVTCDNAVQKNIITPAFEARKQASNR